MLRAFVLLFALSGLSVSCAGENTGADPAAQGLPSPPAAAARLARAPAATAAAGTARMTITATVAGLPGHSHPLTFGGEGALDFSAGRSRSVLDLSGALGSAKSSATELETITAGGVVYVRAPVLTSLHGGSQPWLRLDSDNTGGGPARAALGPLTSLAGSDLGAPMALLAGVDAGSVREIEGGQGAESATTTLRAAVDVSAATAQFASAEERSALESFLGSLGAGRLQIEAELDGEDRLRRLVYEHSLPAPDGAAHQRFEVRYRDFGAPVEIRLPPDDQVRDLVGGPLQGPR